MALPRGIRKRGDSYVADVSYRGQRRTATGSSLEEAVLLKAQLVSELRGDPLVAMPRRQAPAWTIKHAIEVTEQVAWRGSAHGENASYQAREFAKAVGKSRPLDTIDINTLEQWAMELELQGLSDSTINRYLAAVSKVITVAHERGGTPNRPHIPRRKEAQGRIRFLSKEEEAGVLDLLTQWDKRDEADLVVLLTDTGLRLGEALRLEWRDVDFDTGLISVWRTKNDAPRSVPMTKRVREVLEYRHPKSVFGQNGTVFLLSRHSFRQTWDRARAMLGFARDKQFVPHALRHTCASRLVQRGVPLRVVQEWMGHKTINMTMRYAHLAPANLMAAARVLEED